MRDVQQELCGLFRRPFPTMMACVRTENKTYDSFGDQPFLSCEDGESVEVIFSKTDDPFFLDLDRRAPKISIEDELEWGRLVESNKTTLSLKDWFRERSALPPPPSDQWELPPFNFPDLSAPPDFSALFPKLTE